MNDVGQLGERRLAGVAVLAGGLWALIQGVYTGVTLEKPETMTLGCDLGPKGALAVATALVCVSACAAIVFGLRRRARHALLAVGVEAAFAAVWFGLGGWSAAGCAMGA